MPMGLWLSADRILPAESRESTEVSIRRSDAASVVDGERRELCVGNEVSGRRDLRDQLGQDLPKSLGGLRDPDRFAIEPLFDLLPCGADGFGPSEHAGIGDESKEGEQARPGKPHTRAAAQSIIEPLACDGVLLEVGDVRIDENIGVDEDQRSPSPSATASTSAMSSMLPIRHPPSETALVV